MEWISANWIWLLLGLGAIGFLMFRRGGHGTGHGHAGHGGGCCGGMGMSHHDHGQGEEKRQA